MLAGLAGLFVWFAFPAVQPLVGAAAAAAIAYQFISSMIEDVVRKVVREELQHLKEDSHAARQTLSNLNIYTEDTWHMTQQIRASDAMRRGEI